MSEVMLNCCQIIVNDKPFFPLIPEKNLDVAKGLVEILLTSGISAKIAIVPYDLNKNEVIDDVQPRLLLGQAINTALTNLWYIGDNFGNK